MKTLILLAIFGLMTSQAFSKDIFLLTKSIRKKNIIHYDVKTRDCKLAERPISAFWILGESSGQVQLLTPDEIKKFAPVIVRENSQQLEFTLPVFDKVDSPIVDRPILVKLINCQPKAYIVFEGQEIELNEIHGKISIIKMGVTSLMVKGKKADGSNFNYKLDI